MIGLKSTVWTGDRKLDAPLQVAVAGRERREEEEEVGE
jgi:hypothetical protein